MVDKRGVALVTGASSGIGAATARHLAAQGWRVAAVARRKDRLDELAHEARGNVGEVVAVPADITDPEAARGAVTRTVEHFGALDAVVNNAGIMLLGPFETSSPEDWEHMWRLNVLALMHITQEAVPHLRASAAGSRGVADVVNVSSVAGKVARPNFAGYAATKFAVGALSEIVRQELAPDGIRVSCVYPGAVESELMQHVDPAVREKMSSSAVVRNSHAISSEHVADSIGYLLALPPDVGIHEVVVRWSRQPF